MIAIHILIIFFVVTMFTCMIYEYPRFTPDYALLDKSYTEAHCACRRCGIDLTNAPWDRTAWNPLGGYIRPEMVFYEENDYFCAEHKTIYWKVSARLGFQFQFNEQQRYINITGA